MSALPVKDEFRPTLPELLTPRWRASRPATRRAWQIGALALVLVAAALALSFPRDPWIVHSGSDAFDLQYPTTLHRVATPPGAFARVEQRSGSELLQALEVDRLTLPPFPGDVSAILPIYATHFIARMSAHFPGFLESQEGKTRVGTSPGYWISFTTFIDGRKLYGRIVFLVPTLSGSRTGVTISMLTVPQSDVKNPDQVAVDGDLYEPLHTFTFT